MSNQFLQPPPIASKQTYEDLDFQVLYEQEYAAHQETKRKLRIAEDRIEYLEKQVQELQGHVRHLSKLLFAKQSEKDKKKLQKLLLI